MLANRLKICLTKAVSETQSAFVPGRLITDNALAAAEVFHHMKTKRQGNMGYLALKLDMAKTYDRVEWSFLEECMSKLGFHSRWIALIMRCVTSVSFSALVQGVPTQQFIPSRGLRQGDPLSPYLFLLCAEALSGLIRLSEAHGSWKGIRIARSAPVVSHLFFADDSLLFARATCQQSQEIVNILRCYEAASGQQVNFSKSELSFSKNVSEERREEIQGILQVIEVAKHERYLGLPTMIGRSKKVIFASVKDRVWQKLSSWKSLFLSKAGKEVLIKSVLQAIPTYTMSCYYLSADLCRDIEEMICKFWWGDSDRRAIHWMSWKRMCTPKKKGGMGFRDLESFNVALLAKQGWRLITHPDSLLARLLKAKYFQSSSFLEARLGCSPSYAWRSILRGREALNDGLLWSVGNGASISIRDDKWLPRPKLFQLFTRPPDDVNFQRVGDLIDWERRVWREGVIRELFSEEDCELILRIHLVDPHVPDSLTWFYERNGTFSVRSCYHLILDNKHSDEGLGMTSSGSNTEKLWKTLWRLKIPPRIRDFMWRSVSGVLPCNVNLMNRKCLSDPRCFFCGRMESIEHSLFSCVNAKQVWKLTPLHREILRSLSNFKEILWTAMEMTPSELIEEWAVLLYGIWMNRNMNIFQGRNKEAWMVVDSQLHWLAEFKRHHQMGRAARRDRPSDLARWRTPPEGFVKINVDASSTGILCGVGMVARDVRGVVGFLGAKTIQIGTSPDVAEAEAILWAIQKAVDQELTHVIVESDCLGVLTLIKTRTRYRTPLGMLVDQILKTAAGVEFISWVYVNRQGNQAAHFLAGLKPPAPFFGSGLWFSSSALDSILCVDLSVYE